MTVEKAIARSISHNEIVTLTSLDREVRSALESECDDWCDRGDGAVEYWGTTEDGDDWRVHVREPVGDYLVLEASEARRLGLIDEDGNELEHTATKAQIEAAAVKGLPTLAAAQEYATIYGAEYVVDPDGDTHFVG